nr:hypothetical protein [Tanacetum cinerariifolium]
VIEGVLQPVAPTMAEQQLARKNELKACGCRSLSISLKFLESLSQEDITLKFLRSIPSEWRTHTLIWRNKTDLEEQSLDDLTNEPVSAAASVSAISVKIPVSSLLNVDSLSNAMIYSFFASQSNRPQLDNDDLKQIDADDLEEMDLKWECRSPKDTRKNGAAEPQRRNVPVDASTSNALVSQYDGVGSYDWSFQAKEEPTNYALMAFSSSSSSSNNEVVSCSKACAKAYATLQSHYDKKNLEKAEQERDDLKLKLEKFQTSSKNLSELLASQTNAKTGLVYNSQVFTRAMFVCDDYLSSGSDESLTPSPIYDRYQSRNGYHAVLPPYTGIFMPPKPDLVFNNASNDVDNDHLAFNVKLSPTKPDQDLSHTNRPSTPIIEDWVSDSKDESGTKAPQNVPTFAQPTKQVKSPRHSVQHVETFIPIATPKPASAKPTSNSKRRNMKACFVCKSLDYLIKDCGYHGQKMAQTPPRNHAPRGYHKHYARMPLTNPQRHVIPTIVVPKSKLVAINAARPITTVVPKIKVTRPRPAKPIVTKLTTPPRRHINHNPSLKASNSPPRVTAIKAPVDNLQHALKDKGVVDSGCSRYITGNISCLSDFEELNGGYVAFGGNPKGGKIFRKGKIRTGKLDFDDVYFVKELKFNLFSVSQMCDKKNSVLFTDTECLVLSPDFKLLDESQVLLRVPRENNMYNNTNGDAAFDEKEPEFKGRKPESEVNVSPSSSAQSKKHDDKTKRKAKGKIPAIGQISPNNTNTFSATGPSNAVASPTHGKYSCIDTSQLLNDPNMPELEDITYSDDEDDVGAEAAFNNLETSITMFNDEFYTCMFVCFLSQEKPKRVHQALKDLSWIEAMQEELLQFKMQKVWVLVDLPYRKRAIGFKDPDYPDKVYKVVNALYGLHQAPRAWYETLANYLLENGFQRGKIDQTLFIKRQKGDILLVQIYVDDIIFGSTNKDLWKSASTPIDTEKPLLKDPDGEDVDVHTYRLMTCSLMYLTLSRPDIMFVACACARFQVTPKVSHLHAVKRIFRYLKGKPHLGLWYPKDSPFDLVAYLDSDYAGASLDRKSITRGCQFFGCRLIFWKYKKQTVMATSSIEAEYVADASCCAQVLWIQNQLLDYGLISWQCKKQTVVVTSSTKAEYVAAASCCAQVLWIHNQLLDYGMESLKRIVHVTNILSAGYLTTPQMVINSPCLTHIKNWLDQIKRSLFWTTVAVKKVNDMTRLQALVDKKKVVVTEATIREVLRLDDAEGVECLSNEEIFAELARIGYEKPSTRLTFYKAFFSSQWKFLIHSIPQCMSAKRTSWNEFTSSMASAVICISSGKGFSGVETPLVEGMIVEQQVAEGANEVHDEDVNVAGIVAEGDVSAANDGGIIENIDADEDVVLEDAKDVAVEKSADVENNVDIQGRKAKSQAKIYKIDLDHANKVLSMYEEESNPIELQEVVDVVTTAKIITEVVTTASTTITAADVPIPPAITAAPPTFTAAPSRRRKGVVIRDPQEESLTPSIVIHSKAKSKDKGKGILVEEPKPLKKQAQIEQDEQYARELEAELNKNIDWDEVIDHVQRKQKKDKSVKRYQALKRKPQTEAQARKNMMIYLRNVAGFQMDYFKGMPTVLKRLNESQEEKAAKKQKLDEEVAKGANEVHDEDVNVAGIVAEGDVSAANDDKDVVLEDAKDVAVEKSADVENNADIQGRKAKSQAEIYKIDLDHANKIFFEMCSSENDSLSLEEKSSSTSKRRLEKVVKSSQAGSSHSLSDKSSYSLGFGTRFSTLDFMSSSDSVVRMVSRCSSPILRDLGSTVGSFWIFKDGLTEYCEGLIWSKPNFGVDAAMDFKENMLSV